MKKLILLFAFFFLTSINSVNATSGACSYHNGVNCSIGPDIDGSVICNDGWRNSSVSYFDANECFKEEHYCTQEEYDSIAVRYDIEGLRVEVSLANKAMNEKYDIYKEYSYNKNLSGASLIYGTEARKRESLLTDAANAARMVTTRQENLSSALDLVKWECLLIGEASYRNRLYNLFTEKKETPKDILTCPSNSYLVDKMCYCNSGYIISGDSCVEVNNNTITTVAVTNSNQSDKNEVLNPGNIDVLLKSLYKNRNESEENKYEKTLTNDLKEFKVSMSSDEKNSTTNFIVYGISSSTEVLGSGERRALIRDYLDTVAKNNIYWDDLDNMANGKKIVSRNLEKEKEQANNVLKVFRKIFGHTPDFKNQTEDLAWNTMMYRIRFQRDLNKEKKGIEEFNKIFKYKPSSPLDWATVRVLGYVK